MIRFSGRGIVLDVEGTTSLLSYVHDVLFPYARRQLDSFLAARWDDPAVARSRDLIARDAGAASFAAWCGGDPAAARSRELLSAEVVRLMDGDVKATGLKDLQGLIWEQGFHEGVLRSHVFPDVPPALADWSAAGLDVRIYSSGSIAAQRLFFAHTEHGDLTRFLRGNYDTTLGPKRAAASYAAIAGDMGLEPRDILFASDVAEELDAARAAGLATALVVRPGNLPVPEPAHPAIAGFDELTAIRDRR